MWYTPTHLHTQRNIIPLQKERRACLLWQHGWRYCAKANKWGKEWHCMISFQVESKNVRLREQTGGCLRLRGGGIREMLVKGGTLPALRCMSDWVLGSNYSVVTVTDNTGLCTETLLRADLQSYHHTHMHAHTHTELWEGMEVLTSLAVATISPGTLTRSHPVVCLTDTCKSIISQYSGKKLYILVITILAFYLHKLNNFFPLKYFITERFVYDLKSNHWMSLDWRHFQDHDPHNWLLVSRELTARGCLGGQEDTASTVRNVHLSEGKSHTAAFLNQDELMFSFGWGYPRKLL